MKGIILYMSKYGSTKQYAEWIAEEAGFTVIDLNRNGKPDVDNKDVVVIGTWILASSMKTRSWIVKNWSTLKERRVILFSTSGSRPTEELKKTYLEGSLPEEIRKGVVYFPLWGRFYTDKLNFVDRNMIKFASRMFKNDDLMKDLIRGFDEVKRENLKELLEHVRGLEAR